MNWKNEAIEKLRRYDIMRQALLNIPQEINRLKEESTALRSCSADTVHVTGGGGRQEDARINNLIQRQELEQTLKNVRQWLTIFDRALLAMDEDDLMILQQLYIYPQKGAINRLSQVLGVEQSSIYRKRDQALNRFTFALYGFLES